jgi:hypothetical protein
VVIEIEEVFGISMEPLLQSLSRTADPNWWDKLWGGSGRVYIADITVGELIRYVEAQTDPILGRGDKQG